MSASNKPFHLFDVFGIEMEYMIAKAGTLEVLPVSDEIIKSKTGDFVSDFENGEIAWSNELVLHVIELKTNGPKASLYALPRLFQENVSLINSVLKNFNGFLLPTGMHPFMNPFAEARIWPHEYNEVYESYNRIFDCRGHGWSNLQSTHINLPFYDDEEFGMLHAAIRLLLPIIPALTASTPVMDGKNSGFSDMRMEMYRHNQKKVPSVAGVIIPERAFTKKDYEAIILRPIYNEIARYDSKEILQNEWLNSRGAIARFDRNAIEIRIIDSQECPLADITVSAAIIEVLKAMVDERWISLEQQMDWDENRLSGIFLKTIKDGEKTIIDDKEYLRCFGINTGNCTAGEIWNLICADFIHRENFSVFQKPLQTILSQGTLSSRIQKALKNGCSHENLLKVYSELAGCLEKGEMFIP